MKLPNYIKNNFWFLNRKIISVIIFLFCLVLFCVNLLLSLIDLI